MITQLKWWAFNLRRIVPRRKATIKFMSAHLLLAADTIDAQRREIQTLRIRGERLAREIEDNDWTVDSATRLCDAVALWREMGD